MARTWISAIEPSRPAGLWSTMPKASVTHLKSRSSDQDTAVNTRHFYNAMKIFYAKHYAPTAHPLQTRLVMAGIDLAHVARRVRQSLGGSRRVASKR